MCVGQGDCIVDVFDRCFIGNLVDLSFDVTAMKVSIENVRGTEGLEVRCVLERGGSNDRRKTGKFSKLDDWDFEKKQIEVESRFDYERKGDEPNWPTEDAPPNTTNGSFL